MARKGPALSRAEAARDLAEGLVAGVAAADPRWSGPDLVGDEQHWSIVDGEVDDGLYSGRAGIALALAAAAWCTGSQRFADVARSAARGALRGCEDPRDDDGPLDLASGSAGIAFAAAWIGHLLDDTELQADARAVAGRTGHALVRADGPLDLLTGAAGTALAVAAVLPDAPAAEAALRAVAVQARATVRRHVWGVAWPDPGGHPDLLGLAHGASGVAWALARAADPQDPDDSLLTAALEYERAWFDPHTPGWPDLRPLTGATGTAPDAAEPVVAAGWPVAWCHGAVGIGLSRRALLALSDDGGRSGLTAQRARLTAELGAAVQAARQRLTTARAALREHGHADDASLCHGLAGSVELLLAAGTLPGADAHVGAARHSADLLVAERERLGAWPCGLPRPDGDPRWHEPPGLFLGLAGILLTLLRVDHPDELPSPLLLPAVPE